VRIFDSHAHLTDPSFAEELVDVLARAADAGVAGIVTIASNLEDAAAAAELARNSSRPPVWATAGIHPHEADRCTPDALVELERYARSDVVVAVGETGLDFHYENAPRDRQIAAFRSQIALAEQLDLPVVVHSRAADGELAQLIEEYSGRVVGVLHCFTGGAQLLQTALAAGWYVSFSGIVTFARYTGAHHVQAVPGDRLLVETDSPYLAPVPLRGRRNEPSYLQHVVRRVAQLRGEDAVAVAEVTFENACRLYGRGS